MVRSHCINKVINSDLTNNIVHICMCIYTLKLQLIIFLSREGLFVCFCFLLSILLKQGIVIQNSLMLSMGNQKRKD